jgi:glycosyltransferase involved in cell wall biosynthesis
MTGKGTGLSVAIITLNEEANVGPCLESVKWADEVVVCDSGSRDRTLEIAAGYGARIFQDEWLGFAAHKNLAVSRCSQRWVLVLDADERVPPPLRDEIQGILRSEDAADGYRVGRRNFFLGAWIRHGGWYPDRSVRLFRCGRGRFLPRPVHEVVEVSGRTASLQHPLDHFTYASISDFLRRMERYAALAAGELFVTGQRCGVVDLTLRPAWTFLRMYLLRLGFLDGWRGLLLAGLYACYTFAKYAQLWERQRGPAAG